MGYYRNKCYIAIAVEMVKQGSGVSLNIKLLLLEEPQQNNNTKIIYIKQKISYHDN